MNIRSKPNALFSFFFLLSLFFSVPGFCQSADPFYDTYTKLLKSKQCAGTELVQKALYESFSGNHQELFKSLSEQVLAHPEDPLTEYYLRVIHDAVDYSQADYIQFLESCPPSLELAKMYLLPEYLKTGRLDEIRKLRKNLGIITNMLALAPFDNDDGKGFNEPYPPEQELNFSRTYEGKIRPVTWRPVFSSPTGRIKPDNFFRPYMNVTGYFVVFLYSQDGDEGVIKTGTSAAFKIWMNGQLIESQEGDFFSGVDQFETSVSLQKGWNLLLFKSSTLGKEQWLFTLRLSAFRNEVHQSITIPENMESLLQQGPIMFKPAENRCLAILEKATNDKKDKDLSFFHMGHYLMLKRNTDQRVHVPTMYFDKANNLNPSSLYSTFLGITSPDTRGQKKYLSEAISLNPKLLTPQLELFYFYDSIGYDNLANESLQKTLSLHPHDRETLLTAANYYFKKRYFETASEMVSKVKIQDAAWHSSSALLFSAIGSYSNYGKSLQRAWELDKTDSSVRERLIRLHLENNRTEKAKSVLEESFLLFPDSIEILQKMADIELETGDIKAGISKLEKALKICPEDDVILSSLGKFYAAAGDPTNSRIAYKRALSLRPNNSRLKDLIHHLYPENNTLLQQSRKIEDLYKPGEKITETTILLNQQATEIFKDGTFSTLYHLVIYLANETDIERFQKQNVFYNPYNERVEFTKVRVYDQSLRYSEVNDIGDFAYGGDDASLFYDLRVQQAVLPKLGKGSIIQFEYIKHHLAQNMYGWNYFGDSFALQNYYPIKENRFTVISEPNMHYSIQTSHMSNQPKPMKKREKLDDKRVLSYIQTNIQKIILEENMPSTGSFVPTLSISTFTQWKDFGVWLTELYKTPMIPDENIKKLAKELFQGATGTDEILKRAYEYVVGQIRYVGLEYGINGIQPRKVGTVLSTGFGDCKDKATLMTVLLNQAGIKAYVALIRTRTKGTYDYKLPMIEAFDHAVCYVDVSGGKVIDGTADYYTFGDLPPSDRAEKVFLLDGAKSRFVSVPHENCTNNKDTIKSTVMIQKNGGAYIERNLYKTGQKAAQYRYQYHSVQDQQAYLGKYWNSLYPRAEINDITFSGMDTLLEQPSGKYSITIPDFLRRSGTNFFIKSRLVDSDLIRGLVASAKARIHDLEVDAIDMFTDETTYVLPTGWKFLEIPTDVQEDSGPFSYMIQYIKNENSLTIKSSYCLKNQLIRRKEYQQLRAMLLRLNAAEERKIMIEEH